MQRPESEKDHFLSLFEGTLWWFLRHILQFSTGLTTKFMKKNLFFLIIFLTCISVYGQTTQTAVQPNVTTNATPGKIQWMSLEQAYNAIKTEPRKILIDVYTGWCGWCKVMDKNTFTDPKVVEYVNKKYYAVKLDAEQKEDIILGEKKYSYVQQGAGGYHEAAAGLLGGKMSYPTIVYLDEKFNMIQPVAGYQDAKQFHQIVTFFGDNFYRNTDWNKFQAETYAKQYGGENSVPAKQ